MATATKYPYTYSPFGSKVGAVPMPQPASDLAAVYPNLSATNQALSRANLQAAQGIIPGEDLSMMQDENAAWNVASGLGIPAGGTLGGNRLARNVGLKRQELMSEAIKNYGTLAGTMSQTQTVNPELQAQINLQNAVNAAAPEPAMAAQYAKSLFDQYMKMTSKPQTSTGGLRSGRYGQFEGIPREWTPWG